MLANRVWDRARWLTLVLVVVAAGPAWAAEPAPDAPPPAASSREAIEKALTKRVEWSFHKTPLVKVVEQVQKDLCVPVLLDLRSLEEHAISVDTPVTWNLPGLTAEATLRCLLRDHGLVFTPRDEVLLIMTPTCEAEHLRTEVYDVAGLLLPEEPKAADNQEVAKTADKTDAQEGAKPREAASPPTRGMAALLRVIKAVAPSTWEEVGGTGSVRAFCVEERPRLIISQTQEVQQSIARLLATLDKMQKDPSLRSLEVASESQLQAEEAIQKQLDKRVDVAFHETPLSDVVAWFCKTLEVPGRLDWRALEEQAIPADTPVTLQLRGVTARTALEHILGALNLTWTTASEMLQITTPEVAAETLAVRVYNVTDLSKQSQGTAELGDPCHRLAEIIQATAQPCTWEKVGGTGELIIYGDTGELIVYGGPDLTVLVILQTAQVHDEIASLLAQLRAGANGK